MLLQFKYLCKVSDILKKDSDCKFSEKEKIMRELQQISNHSKVRIATFLEYMDSVFSQSTTDVFLFLQTNCTEELENMSLSNTTILMKNLMSDLSKWAKTMLFRNGLDSKET